MRSAKWLWLPIAAFVSVVLVGPSQAGMFSYPKALKPTLERIKLESYVLPPVGHSKFCGQYPQDCEVHKMAFRGRKFELTPQRWAELLAVNTTVNRFISPEPNLLGIAGEKWIISPVSGDCNDYAVTKRHELLARGWPSRTLLLAEVAVPNGEHHVVVVVRTAQGDYVLDNLSASIKPWSRLPYQWFRVQTPSNPRFWSKVRMMDA